MTATICHKLQHTATQCRGYESLFARSLCIYIGLFPLRFWSPSLPLPLSCPLSFSREGAGALSKETWMYGESDLSISLSKETWIYGESDLSISLSKETWIYGERDLHISREGTCSYEKRPTYMKRMKRDLHIWHISFSREGEGTCSNSATKLKVSFHICRSLFP